MTIDWNSLLSSGIGAVIGSMLTLVAVLVAHLLEQRKQNQKDRRTVHGVLQAIHDEIETLWDTYSERAGAHLEALQPGKPLDMYWAISQEYFTVYNNNAFLIGKVSDHDLRKSIVATYTKARGLIDSFRLNNELVHKYEQAALLARETNTDIHKQIMHIHHAALVKYAEQLKLIHQELKEKVQHLLRELRKQGVLANNVL